MESTEHNPYNINNEEDKISGITSAIILIHEYVVDFFACLMPGIFTVIFFIIILFSAFNIIANIIDYDITNISTYLFETNELSIKFFEKSICMIVISYIFGFLLYRQDPNKPDRISACYNLLRYEELKQVNAIDFIINKNQDYLHKHIEFRGLKFSFLAAFFGAFYLKKIFKISSIDNDENEQNSSFPYFKLKCFLCQNKNIELAELIPWKYCTVKQEPYMPQMFINLIKLNLFTYSNKLYNIICKNEAHVRLCTTLWFSCKYLIYCIAISILFILIFSISIFSVMIYYSNGNYRSIILLFKDKFFNDFIYFGILFFMLLLLAFILYKIIQCIHYMRLREIIYMLESIKILEVHLNKQILQKFPCNSCLFK